MTDIGWVYQLAGWDWVRFYAQIDARNEYR